MKQTEKDFISAQMRIIAKGRDMIIESEKQICLFVNNRKKEKKQQ